MRETWQKGIDKLPGQATEGKRVESVDGTFDDFSKAGLTQGEVDGVLIAQAWHWCPDYEGALVRSSGLRWATTDHRKREVAAYLKPGQPLILIWNLENEHSHVSSKVRALFEQHDKGTPQYHKMLWRQMFDTKAYSELFESQEETKHPWSLGMTEDSVCLPACMTRAIVADVAACSAGVLQILPDRAVS